MSALPHNVKTKFHFKYNKTLEISSHLKKAIKRLEVYSNDLHVVHIVIVFEKKTYIEINICRNILLHNILMQKVHVI